MALAPALSAVVRDLDSDISLSNVRSMAMIVDGYFPAPLVAAFAVLSAISLCLSALGLYAVVAFQVPCRTREFGVRMALGAEPRAVVRLVMGEGLRLTAVGLVIGGAAGLAIGRFLSHQFQDVVIADPILAAAVTAVLAGVSVSACVLPGRRATRIGPAAALRQP